jgi:hypothetical protein
MPLMSASEPFEERIVPPAIFPGGVRRRRLASPNPSSDSADGPRRHLSLDRLLAGRAPYAELLIGDPGGPPDTPG